MHMYTAVKNEDWIDLILYEVIHQYEYFNGIPGTSYPNYHTSETEIDTHYLLRVHNDTERPFLCVYVCMEILIFSA